MCTPLRTFSTFHYMFYIVLSGYNSRTINDIKLKFSAFLSFVETTKYVKFQSPKCTGFKVGILRISPIHFYLKGNVREKHEKGALLKYGYI